MNRKTIIVIVTPTIECWGNFKKLCEAKGLPYHSLKAKSFPIRFNEFLIWKVPFN